MLFLRISISGVKGFPRPGRKGSKARSFRSPSRIRAYSGIIKANIEIKSIRVGGVSCGIRSGNVFAN